VTGRLTQFQLHHAKSGVEGHPQHIPSDHPHAADHTAKCPACAAGREDYPLPTEVATMMAKREHRMHHWLWHEVRNSWNRYPRDIQRRIDALGWRPPRPVMDGSNNPDLKNDSGEDFLYMHRQMIADVNRILSEVGDPNYRRVQGWMMPPPPGDRSYPVPPAWFDPEGQGPGQTPIASLERTKSDVFYQKRFQSWQRAFRDPTVLRTMSLGALGVMIEITIHNAMHLRWAAFPGSVRPDPLQKTGDIDPTGGDVIPTEWDDPQYDFLADTYSSHVNPIFWKLHGWIDDRIEDWKIANGVFGNDFWKGTWVGKMPEHGQGQGATVHGMLENPDVAVRHGTELQQVAQLVAQAGVSHTFMPAVSIEAW
jgi:hypothetical protein